MKETIELRQIIEILVKGKWIIILSTIISLLIFSIVSWLVLDEEYESHAVVQLSSGVQDTGIMSNYITTEFTPLIYMERIQNEILMGEAFTDNNFSDFDKGNLTLENQVNTNLVKIKYVGNSPEESQASLQVLLEETKNNMNNSVKNTLNQFEQTYLSESKALSTEIGQLLNQYNSIVTSNNLPEVLILQTISSSQYVVNLTEQQTDALGKIDGALQNQLLQLKAKVDIKSEEYRSVLSKYQSVKTGLDSFKPDPFIKLIIEPTLNEDPISPNRALNLVVGMMVGLVLGVCLVLFRNYWIKSGENLR